MPIGWTYYLLCLARTLEGDELEPRDANLEESEVPAEVEGILGELLSSLEDKAGHHAVYGALRLADRVYRTRSFVTQLLKEWQGLLSIFLRAFLAR